ncbi:hypothetical protein BV22DRAFT_493895 [Leucogyrophana mollusca]|uniref:Uncharacterized protein n=1 Tax=Leucogyrophana mollusca TaxID=85980 RepID=A0ACB8BHG6_9AGAM|nr:hypothetical protein BV22DRAFT_493895 [Leucogyrophana mollusca]
MCFRMPFSLRRCGTKFPPRLELSARSGWEAAIAKVKELLQKRRGPAKSRAALKQRLGYGNKRLTTATRYSITPSRALSPQCRPGSLGHGLTRHVKAPSTIHHHLQVDPRCPSTSPTQH